MSDETSAGVGLTDAPAPSGVTEAVPATGEAVTSQDADTTTTIATPEAGTVEVADPDSDDEPPPQSSPEQVSRWKKRTLKIERLEKELTAQKEQAANLAPIEPIRDHVLSIVEGLGAEKPDVPRVVDALYNIDAVGTNEVAGYLMHQYAPTYLQQVFQSTPDEVQAALAAYRGQMAAPPPEPWQQQPPPYGAPAPQVGGLTPQIEAELALLDPNVANVIRQNFARQAQIDAQLREINQRDTEVQQTVKLEEYRKKHVYPTLIDSVKAWGVEPGTPEADDFVALLDAAVEKTRGVPRGDLEIIESAQKAYLDGRHGVAANSAPAIRAIIERHANAIGARHYGHRQKEALAASERAKERAAATTAPPAHVPGGAAAPGPATAGVTAPANYGGMPAVTAQRYIDAGYRFESGKWHPPA